MMGNAGVSSTGNLRSGGWGSCATTVYFVVSLGSNALSLKQCMAKIGTRMMVTGYGSSERMIVVATEAVDPRFSSVG